MVYYDIIGDVHGRVTKLRSLLGELGYRQDESGVYRHPERTAVFVGDLIDRGDDQLEVLQLVKPMVDAGSAQLLQAPAAARLDPVRLSGGESLDTVYA